MPSTKHIVSAADTAASVGSGDVPVLATPVLAGWLEAESFKAAAEDIDESQTTVGTALKIEHTKAVPVGRTVRVKSSKSVNHGHRLVFHCKAIDDRDELVATAEVERAVVTKDRFLKKCEAC